MESRLFPERQGHSFLKTEVFMFKMNYTNSCLVRSMETQLGGLGRISLIMFLIFLLNSHE